jgi:hypothetical protein
LHQRSYLKGILKEFGMTDCHPKFLPIKPGLVLTEDTSTAKVSALLYQRLVEKLMYAINIRVDIGYAVEQLSLYLVKPQQQHLNVVLQTL